MVKDISFYKSLSKKRMFIKFGLILFVLLSIFIITLYNDMVYKIIGFSKFMIVYILGIVLSFTYLILNFKLKVLDEDVVFSLVSKTKKEKEFYEIFEGHENYKLSKNGFTIKIFSNILEYYLVIEIAILCVVFIFTFIFFPAVVEQHSMEKTLFDGDRVLVQKTSKINKSDIIVFEYDSDYLKEDSSLDGDLLIKRVIALENDSFYCKNGKIYINDVLLEEDYINNSNFKYVSYSLEDVIMKNSNKEELLSLIINGTIPEGYYLVLGDNRLNSNDSEEFGLIHESQIVGVVKYYKNDFGWHKN